MNEAVEAVKAYPTRIAQLDLLKAWPKPTKPELKAEVAQNLMIKSKKWREPETINDIDMNWLEHEMIWIWSNLNLGQLKTQNVSSPNLKMTWTEMTNCYLKVLWLSIISF